MISQDLLGWLTLLLIFLGALIISKKYIQKLEIFIHSFIYKVFMCDFRSILFIPSR